VVGSSSSLAKAGTAWAEFDERFVGWGYEDSSLNIQLLLKADWGQDPRRGSSPLAPGAGAQDRELPKEPPAGRPDAPRERSCHPRKPRSARATTSERSCEGTHPALAREQGLVEVEEGEKLAELAREDRQTLSRARGALPDDAFRRHEST
jgi:hypothetical protein